ncbi:LacI family DNA-binding transcriptional regulator [Microlunatus sp. Y2014]|uniref:LacI family DNA-binding transcriptional regulator n=1 Tax=Microlunatus sp. Y2014 TaxID=3418488 RepID=UPI003DA71C65
MKARLVDVAKEAGVSPKTVSNYVNGYPFMSKATTEKVRAAIEKLDYVPNRMARNLRTGRTGIIALAVPELNVPYFAELAGHVTTAAEKHGVTVLIDQTDGEPDRERRVAAGLGPQAIDGLIMSPQGLDGNELASLAAIPMVLLGERLHPEGVPYVGVDNVAAATAATNHLIDSGYRRIAAIGRVSQQQNGTGSLRLQGYQEALAAAGLKPAQGYTRTVAAYERAEGAREMDALLDLKNPPDAVFCFNDLLAVGALSTLHRRGVTVPDEVAVMGWDDISEVRYTWPPITSVSVDKAQLAEVAVDHLLALLAGAEIEDPQQFVDFAVEVRASTG